MQHATHITPRASDPHGAGTLPRRRGLSRVLQTTAALALVVLGGLVATTSSTGCGSGVDTPFCDGGFVRKAPTETDPGVCEGKCAAEACGADNACSDNHCVLTCTSHLDCVPLVQDCVTGKVEDDTEKTLSTCENTGKGTIGVACPFGNECSGDFKCPDGTPCDPKNTSGAPCAQADCNSPFPPAYACHDGKACDPKCTGDACPCPPAECNPLVCRSNGAGDAEAFCTLQDCHADTDCPGGYWCGAVRDPHEICGSSPKKGNSDFCGTTDEPCVDPSMSAANGTTFAEGPHCALRNQCLVRKQCAPCETDLDCSAVAGQHCKRVGPEKACVRDCVGETDCEQGFMCTDGSCVPRAGSCVGDGSYCQPCRNDNDCGGPSSNLSCVSFGGAERMCIDVTISMSCTSNADCPVGPDGRHGLCANETVGASPGDAAYHKCYLPPFNAETNHFSCWRGNAGDGCSKSDDCISGKCQASICCVPSGTSCRADDECCSKHCNGADAATGTLGACM